MWCPLEHNFIFQLTVPDVDALLPETSLALEQMQELFSRRKYPKMWALTRPDEPMEQGPTARAKRRLQGQVQGLVNWIVALLLLPMAFITRNHLLAIIGALCLGIGVVELWQYLPKTLGILSLLAGVFFLMAAWAIPLR